MSSVGRSGGFWRSVSQLPGRTPLRVKLIAAVLTLVAIALVIISVAGFAFLRSYLLNAADSQLQTMRNEAPYSLHGVGGPPPIAGVPSQAVEAVLPSGQVVAAPYPDLGKAGPQIPASDNGGQPFTVPAQSGDGRWRIVVVPGGATVTNTATGASSSAALLLGVNVTDSYGTLRRLTLVDVIVSAFLLVALLVVGTALVRASLRPLTEIEQTAGAIAAGDLSRRVPERDPRTEVGRLGRSLNAMLAQIEAAFRARAQSEAAARQSEERMRQFVADASHELRTPLTAIRGFAEYYRQRGGVESTQPADPTAEPEQAADDALAASAADAPGAPASDLPGEMAVRNGLLERPDLDRIMRRVEQESARMGVLVEDMLLLARLDQQRPLEHATVDLLTLAADAVHDARVMAPDRNINLTVGAGAAFLVTGDEVRLRQVIGNLMSNALAHTPEESPIDVRIRSGSLDVSQDAGPAQAQNAGPAQAQDAGPAQAQDAGPAQAQDAARPAAVLEIADQGPGLTPEQAARAFERFYRADQARTSDGTGLGLAIVSALVAAHGGAVWVESPPEGGAVFRIALPLAPEAIGHDLDEEPPAESELPEDSAPREPPAAEVPEAESEQSGRRAP